MDSSAKSTAIVIGASMAGLFTARTLADHFDRVVLVDEDRLPDLPQSRSGTPQARQYHILLLRGLQAMQTLFPGLDEELKLQGACTLDLTQDILIKYRGEWLSQFASGQNLLSCNRSLLEANIRRRVRMLHNVELLEGVEATGLETNQKQSTLTGVRLRRRRLAKDLEESYVLDADLIVDATGRRSQAPQWLNAIGFESPKETVVDSFLGYVTRRYRAKGQPSFLRPLLISANPPNQPLSGLILPEENGNWVVMMAGVNRNYPPTEEKQFDDFARRLDPQFHKAIQNAEPLGKAYSYRGTQSRWRHYENLERWPERFIVIGDAFCAFNPIYGQGMTVAALCAIALAKEVKRNQGKLDKIALRTRHQFAQITKGPWLLATGADLEWPETEGERRAGLSDRFAGWYLSKLLAVVPKDRAIRIAFNQVNQMVKRTESLFSPSMIVRVLAATISPKILQPKRADFVRIEQKIGGGGGN